MRFRSRNTAAPLLPILSLLLVCGLAIGAEPNAENIQPNALFSEHMVLQRDTPIPVWGAADAGGVVVVELGEQSVEATADQNGRWQVTLQPMPAGGPHTLTIRGKDALAIADVYVGEVWLASGQSNMQWTVGKSNDADTEVAAAQYPQIRLFRVNNPPANEPVAQPQGKWSVCSPESVGGWSAVAYFFARKLHQDLNVPIGVLETSWGGTSARVWTPVDTLIATPELQPIAEERTRLLAEVEKPKLTKEQEAAQMKVWEETIDAKLADDSTAGWAAPAFATADWKPMALPQMWESAGLKIDGAVWFRRTVTIPEAWAGRDLVVQLGAIDDFDRTYWNGEAIGSVGRETENFWSTPRRYTVPGDKVKAGEATLAVRVVDHWGGGGFSSPADSMSVAPADGNGEPASLAGEWLYQIEWTIPEHQARPEPAGGGTPRVPSCLFHARIQPLIPYALRGAIWYQGESDAGRAVQYRTLFRRMIQSWRERWALGDFPFLFVQLANFRAAPEQPGESDWAELREAQTLALQEPNTAMAVAIDVGEAKDIHPRNKQDVGLRLALPALAKTYDRAVAFSGPVYESMTVEGSTIRLRFKHADGGLVAKGGDLKQFAIAAEGQPFVWAQAKIEDDSVVVWSDEVTQPAAVRYAWANNPEGANLYNGAGLPASPFRTDERKLLTQDRK